MLVLSMTVSGCAGAAREDEGPVTVAEATTLCERIAIDQAEVAHRDVLETASDDWRAEFFNRLAVSCTDEWTSEDGYVIAGPVEVVTGPFWECTPDQAELALTRLWRVFHLELAKAWESGITPNDRTLMQPAIEAMDLEAIGCTDPQRD